MRYGMKNFRRTPKVRRGYKQKSALKFVAVFFIAFIFIFSGSYYATYLYARTEVYAFNDIPSTESPYPLWNLNETLAQIIVDGDPATNGILGATQRQAQYHSVLGYMTSVVFRNGSSPDDAGITADGAIVQQISSLGDAAFLTGLYLFGETVRWAVYAQENNSAGMAVADHQINRTLEGLYILTHVTGTPGEVARYAIPLGINYSVVVGPDGNYYGGVTPARTAYNPSYPGNAHVHPKMDWTNWTYFDYTSRDQNIGVMMGLAGVIAFCRNETLKNFAGEIACDIVDYFIDSHWFMSMNTFDGSERFTNGADFDGGLFQSGWAKLAFMQVVRQVRPEKYDGIYNEMFTARNQYLKLDAESTLQYILDGYYPLNLFWCIAWMFTFFIDHHDPFYQNVLKQVVECGYHPVRNHRNAWFQLLYMSLLEPSARASMTRVQAEVQDAIQRMCVMREAHFNGVWELPYAEIGIDPSNETQMETKFWDRTADKWNDILGGPFKFLAPVYSIELFPSHSRYPVPINYRTQYQFPWQFSPFLPDQFGLQKSNSIEYFHTELTTIYWLARYYGIVNSSGGKFTYPVITQAQVRNHFPTLTLPAGYANTTSILKAFGIW